MHRLVIALVTLLGLAAGTVVAGYLLVFSASTDRASALAPANSAFYVNIYLQPSTGQQANLGGLIGRLPGFADAASLDAKIDQIVGNLLSGSGVDYLADIKPWLGDQVAIAGWSDGTDTPATVVIAAVKDAIAAAGSVEHLLGGGGLTFAPQTHAGVELRVADGGAYAFVDDMLVMGETPDALRAVIDAGGGAESLADRADFREAMDRVPDDHLASAFVDLHAAAGTLGAAEEAAGSFGAVGAALVAEQDGLRLSGGLGIDLEAASPSARDRHAMGTEPSSLAEWMPDGTIASFVAFGLGQTLTDVEDGLAGVDGADDVVGMLDTIRALAAFGFGIDIDTDLLPLLGREVGIAVTGLEADAPSGLLLLRPDDATTARDALDDLAERMGGESGVETRDGVEMTTLTIPDTATIAYAVVDGIVLIGLEADDVGAAIAAHRSGAVLARTPAYQRTFEVAGTRAGTEAFVEIGSLIEALGHDGDLAALPSDARDILSQLGTFGLTMPSRDDQIEFHAVVTVDDRAAE